MFLNGFLATLSGFLATLSGFLATLSGFLATLSGFLAFLNGFLATLSGFLATLSGFLATLSGFLATLSGSWRLSAVLGACEKISPHTQLCFLIFIFVALPHFANVDLLNIRLRFNLRSFEQFLFRCCVDRFLRKGCFPPSKATF
jgi:hypothetical protein